MKAYISGVVDVTPIEVGGSPPLQIWGPNDPRPGYGLPGNPGSGGNPGGGLGLWGPGDPRPSNPIANAPGIPGYNPGGGLPPYIHGPTDPFPGYGLPEPPRWVGAKPEHPIVIQPGGSLFVPADSLAPGVPKVDMVINPPAKPTPK